MQSNSQRQFDGELTFLGRVLAHLPVDLLLGKLIVLGHVFGCLEECLIIGITFCVLVCVKKSVYYLYNNVRLYEVAMK